MTAQAERQVTGVDRSQQAGLADRLRRQLSRLPLHFFLIALVIIWSIPTVALLVSSFRDASAIDTDGWWNALFRPGDWTLENYDNVLSATGNRDMLKGFTNSILITVPATALVILVASFAAYAFAWMQFPLRNVLFLIVVALLVVPLQMTLIPVLRMYNFLGVESDLPILGGRVFGNGSWLGIWLAHAAYGLPFAVFLLRNFFGGLPRDLFESAYLDGATELQVFRSIVLPLSMPAIAALAIFQFLWTWNDLLIALVLLQDPDLYPLTVRINGLVSSFGTNYEVLTAAAFVSMALPLFIFFALQRYFVQGILAGSVKG